MYVASTHCVHLFKQENVWTIDYAWTTFWGELIRLYVCGLSSRLEENKFTLIYTSKKTCQQNMTIKVDCPTIIYAVILLSK